MNALVWLVVLAAGMGLFAWPRRKRGRAGAAAAGRLYDQRNEGKRKAVEIIVEDRAGARDPEDRDGNLPDLEDPSKSHG